MRCPHCGGKLKVMDSRKDGDEVLRRRQCLTCRKNVYTFECIDEGNGVRKRLQWIRATEKTRNVSKGIERS